MSTVQSLQRGLNILSILAASPVGLSISELSEATGIQRTTLYGLVNTLIQTGFLFKEPSTGKFCITSKLYELAYNYPKRHPLFIASEASLSYLQEHFVSFSVRICYFKDECDIFSLMGETTPLAHYGKQTLYATASGKILLSGKTDEEIKEIYSGQELQRYTATTITDLSKLIEEIHKIRERGYASDYCELIETICCFAFPLRNAERIVGCLAFSNNPSQMKEHQDELCELGLMHAKLISQKLGWSFSKP